jgi:hypothetical protein
MIEIIKLSQLAISLSVAYVWIFRYHNVLKEFNSFGLSDIIRNFVGVSKIALATLLMAGIWYPDLVIVSASLMGGFMIAAQFFHFKVGNPIKQKIPSLILLILCGGVAFFSI